MVRQSILDYHHAVSLHALFFTGGGGSLLQLCGVWVLNFLILLMLMIQILVYGEPLRTKNSASAHSFYSMRKAAEKRQLKVDIWMISCEYNSIFSHVFFL